MTEATTGTQVLEPPATGGAVEQLTPVIALVRRAAVAYDRHDLVERVADVARRVDEPDVRVPVVGEFKQGKSSLVNALLGTEICPVDDDLATAVPTTVRYGETPALLLADDGSEPGPSVRRPLSVDRLRTLLAESPDHGGGPPLRDVEVELPRTLLRDGLVLIDTPGVGGLASGQGTVTVASLATADAALFVTDASQELTAAELGFLHSAVSLCPEVTVVLTKIDLYPAWRRIAQLDAAHLDGAGVSARVIPVSAAVRHESLALEDRQLNDESGFPDLVAHLRALTRAADRLAARRALHDLGAVIGQLTAPFRIEREALTHESREELVARLEAAHAAAQELRNRSARWQVTLSDGVGDLTSDVDHDMRARVRNVLTEAEARLDGIDPAEDWTEFEPWLYRRVAEEVTASYQLVRERATQLAERVGNHFRLDQLDAVPVELALPDDVLPRTDRRARPELERQRMSRQLLTGFRGTYSGILMFGMLGQLAGVVLTGPAAIALGLVLGRNTVREERKRALLLRRQQAKASVRAYVDEIAFLVGKDSRDSLRSVHRTLRNTFEARAGEVSASAERALAAARDAAERDDESRRSRVQDVDAELARLDALQQRLEGVAQELDR